MSPRPRARIKDAPEDFVVEEIPAYEPQGAGDHLFVRFTKRDLTTDQAVRALAEGAEVPLRDVGVAGLKDKVGVTTQTVSLPVPKAGREGFDERVRALCIPGVVIHEVRRHGNKLRTGHLAGNRFRVVLRGVADEHVDDVVRSLECAGREGIPNAFGSQRFGREHDNADRALAWLTGRAAGPRDPRKKRFLWSALQSEMFNAVLERRVADGTWRTPLLGDLLKKTDSGGLFPCTDEAVDRVRADRGEVSPTGPMFGTKMREPTGRPGELERAVLVERLGAGFDLGRTRPFGEGTRRALRLDIEGLTASRLVTPRSHEGRPVPEQAPEQDAALLVCFVLPKGAYATSVLGAAVALEPDATPSPAEMTGDETDRSTERAETRARMIERIKSAMVGMGASWVIWLMFALSVVSLAIMLERAWFFWSLRDDVSILMRDLGRLLRAGDLAGARQRLEQSPSAEAAVVVAGVVEAEHGADSAKEAMAGAANLQKVKLERNLAYLGTLGNNAPFIGLLGTVIGIVGAFEEFGKGPAQLAVGAATAGPSEAVMRNIAEALVTTAIGLVIAIPAVAAFNWFQRMVKITLSNTEALGHVLLAHLKSEHAGASESGQEKVADSTEPRSSGKGSSKTGASKQGGAGGRSSGSVDETPGESA